MKTTKLLSFTITAIVALASSAWAGPRGGGGGFAGGGHFGGSHFSGYSGGIGSAPTLSGGGARFSGNRSIGGLSRVPQQFYYYSAARTSGLTAQHAFVRQVPNRRISPNAGRVAAVNRQSNRVDSTARQKRVPDPRLSKAQNRQSFMKNHAFARHDSNWHRDWDKHRAHFHNNRVFVFIDGFWWGLYPWDYYPYYGYDYGDYPYDYSYGYPDDSSGYPYDGAEYSSSQPYSYYDGYAPSGTDSNGVVSAVQSKLSSFGYYHGAIDGVVGDETEAALARYQQDYDLSVTGTVTAATLHALGLQ